MGFHSKARQTASSRWEPAEGGEYTVTVVEVRERETKSGFPSYGLWLEVVSDGDGNGERFWDNTFFSANDRANGMSYAKLEAASPHLNEAFWAGDPSSLDIERALMGSVFIARCTYDENDRDPDRPWLRCTYIPSDDVSTSDTIDIEEPF